MESRGKLIVIEGIDGSGKRTQTELLGRAFAARGIPFYRIGFPRYKSFFGQLVAKFLNGDFGQLEAVDAHFSALLYAGDRFEARQEIGETLASGKNILTDRYIPSNLAHQAARIAPERRDEFMDWLRQLEYGIYQLPAEDLVVYLRLNANDAQRLVERKSERSYTTLKRDLQEADLGHLEQASLIYDRLAREPNWATIECLDPSSRLRTAEEIHRDVLAVVESRTFNAVSTVTRPK